MNDDYAKGAFLDEIANLRSGYNICRGKGADNDRRRLVILVSDILCGLSDIQLFSLLGRKPRSIAGPGITDTEAAPMEAAYFESAFYTALKEHGLRCDPTEAEVSYREAKRKGSSTDFNPLAIHNIVEFSPKEALKRYPIIRDIISVLQNGSTLSEEKHGEQGTSNRRTDVAQRVERSRASQNARHL